MKQQICLYFLFILGTLLIIPGYAFSRMIDISGTISQRFTPDSRSNVIWRVEEQVSDSIPKKGTAADYLQALLQFEPWAESVWHEYPKIPYSGYFGDGKSGGNGGIRGSCGIALSYAVLVRAFPHDLKRFYRLKRIEEALRYAEETHKSGRDSVVAVDGKKWGFGWQSTLWAASMGFTAALVEKDIDPKVIAGCKRVVAVEADRLSRIPPPSGYKLDTKAEENAWNSNIVSLAAAWMPSDPRAKKWLQTAKLYLANTYTVPSDSSGSLGKWIMTQTLYPSYALQNHGFYHPAYQMVAGMSLGDSYVMAKMINPKIAKKIEPFAEHNVEHVWRFLQGLVLDSGELAYPSGFDWSLHSFGHVSYLSWLAAHFNGPVAQWAEPRLAKQILYRQAINKDGRFVGESCPHGFYREAVEARRVAMAYLQDAIEGFPEAKGFAPQNYIVHYPQVKLIIQRSKNALTTISYGTKTMALVYPLGGKNASQRFLISPNTSTLIGPEGETKLNSFKRTKKGFHAELWLNDHQGRRSKMVIESTPDAVVFLEIPSDSSKLIRGQWLLSAIENDQLTGGKREVIWKNDSMIIRERSGVETSPVISGWINVNNWMGFVALPGGSLIYQAASGYNRNGAAEDYVYYKPQNINEPRAVILLPGKDAKVTKKVMKSVGWSISDTKCKLYFKTPDGGRMKVNVSRKE